MAEVGCGFGGDRRGSRRGQCFWVSIGESGVGCGLMVVVLVVLMVVVVVG